MKKPGKGKGKGRGRGAKAKAAKPEYDEWWQDDWWGSNGWWGNAGDWWGSSGWAATWEEPEDVAPNRRNSATAASSKPKPVRKKEPAKPAKRSKAGKKTDEMEEYEEAEEDKEAEEAQEAKEAKGATKKRQAKEAEEAKEAKGAKKKREAKEAEEAKEAKGAKNKLEAKEAEEAKDAKMKACSENMAPPTKRVRGKSKGSDAVSSKDNEESNDVDDDGELLTFARRYKPQREYFLKKWLALREAYNTRMRVFLTQHSKMEDIIFSKESNTCMRTHVSGLH